MANWTGKARSNYVLIKDRAGLEAAWPKGVPLKQTWHDEVVNAVCFDSTDGDEGWPSSFLDDETAEPVEFNVGDSICPFMEDGEVLVVQCIGSETMHYVTGYAEAWHSDGRLVTLNLDRIYDDAAKAFDMPKSQITIASYTDCKTRDADASVDRPRG
jgi:hypothetical protein